MTQKLLPQYDDRGTGSERDFAAAGRMSLYALERMLRSTREEPNWRLRARLCAAYYDGKQLSEVQKQHIRMEDLEERAINLIRPVINSVLGQEAKSRTDVRVEADNDDYADVAEVISAALKEAERESRAHMAVSEAYASMVKKGLGWVHVSRNADPLAYAYRVESIPVEEIWWDWLGQRGPTLEDGCRWLVRMRFVDLDEVMASMPEKAKVLKKSAEGWDQWHDFNGAMVGEPDDLALMGEFNNERRFNVSVQKHEWMDSARKMVKLYEVWYRAPAQVVVLHLGPTKRVVYDEKDPRHVEAVARGLVKISKAVTSQVRRALYAGPYRLLDEATTLRRFPYIPFFAFRDDGDGSPYGLIDGMVAPQDEFNERRLRIQWMLKARQIQLDSDALDTKFNTLADIADAVMRPDLVTITNPNRMNKTGPAVVVKNDLEMQKEQFEVMQDSKQLIQDTAGRYASQMGNAQVQSGIANSILVEQGEQSMGEMNDNYTYGRRATFEQLVCEITQDHLSDNLAIPIGTGKTRRIVALNGWDPQQGKPINMVKDADIKTALAETPNTPAYRQTQQQQLAVIIQALSTNPQATAILAPAYIEATSLVDRQGVADSLRKVAGIPLAGDKDGQAKADAMAEAIQAKKLQNDQRLADAAIDEKVATAESRRATARLANANAELAETRLHAGLVPAEVDKTIAETDKIRQDAEAANDEDDAITGALSEAEAA